MAGKNKTRTPWRVAQSRAIRHTASLMRRACCTHTPSASPSPVPPRLWAATDEPTKCAALTERDEGELRRQPEE